MLDQSIKDQAKHYFHFKTIEVRHWEIFPLIREYCERNQRVLKFYRLLSYGYVAWDVTYECLIEGGSREELLEFFRDHDLDKISTNCDKQL